LQGNIYDQVKFRFSLIEPYLSNISKLDVVIGRGGPLKPLKSGIYGINDEMLSDYYNQKYSKHSSNLGAILADKISRFYYCPSFIVDPVTSDDFIPEARISGIPGIERKSRSHSLNIKYCVRKAEKKLKIIPQRGKFVVAHLGSGFSIASIVNNNIIDVNDALLGMGPFSIERAGSIPLQGLLDLFFKNKLTETQLIKLFSKNSGFMGYLNTNDLRIVEEKMYLNSYVKLIYDSMIYQICKEIGSAFGVLDGVVDSLILTGGLCLSKKFTYKIKKKCKYFSNVIIFPGSFELDALVFGGINAIKNPSIVKKYHS